MRNRKEYNCNVGVKGQYRVSGCNADGTVCPVTGWIDNLITTSGKNVIARLISGELSSSSLEIAVGTDNTSVVSIQTDLGNETTRAGAKVSLKDNNKCHLLAVIEPSFGTTLYELGVFVGTEIISRVVVPQGLSISYTGQKFLVEWQYSFIAGQSDQYMLDAAGYAFALCMIGLINLQNSQINVVGRQYTFDEQGAPTVSSKLIGISGAKKVLSYQNSVIVLVNEYMAQIVEKQLREVSLKFGDIKVFYDETFFLPYYGFPDGTYYGIAFKFTFSST